MKKIILLVALLLNISFGYSQVFNVVKKDCNITFVNASTSKVWYSFDLYQAVISYNPTNDINQFSIGDNQRSGVFNKVQIVNFNTIPILIDSFYSWKNDCINLHKGSGGGVDTIQNLYISGDTLSIGGGNSVTLPTTSTDTASLSNRINSINTNSLSYIDKATSGFAPITGTASGISYSYQIPAGTITVGDITTTDIFVSKTGTVNTMTIRFYVNTSNTISGAILAGTANYANTNLYAGITRTFSVESSTVTNVFNATASVSGDIPSSSASAMSSLNIDWSINQWIIVHLIVAGAGDVAGLKMFRMYK